MVELPKTPIRLAATLTVEGKKSEHMEEQKDSFQSGDETRTSVFEGRICGARWVRKLQVLVIEVAAEGG